jgi:hypothetical protein
MNQRCHDLCSTHLHHTLGFVAPKVWDIWSTMEVVTYAMATVCPYNTEARFLSMCTDDLSHLPVARPRLDDSNCPVQALISDLQQCLCHNDCLRTACDHRSTGRAMPQVRAQSRTRARGLGSKSCGLREAGLPAVRAYCTFAVECLMLPWHHESA